MICKKIGVDFHGVINASPLFFKEFCGLVKSQGTEVHIISGGPRETIEKFLRQQQIEYDRLWCIFDYFDAENEVEFLPDGSFHVDDEAWDSAKAEYCRLNEIGLQIDDSTVYGRYFTTPYCLYDERSKKGLLNGIIIDFSGSAAESVEKLADLLQ